MNDENKALWKSMVDRYERKLLLTVDALIGYFYGVAGTLFVEFVLHHDKFLTPTGFQEHLFTALGAGVLTSSAYLRNPTSGSKPPDQHG